jgi:DNA-binding response OmpR family regulator
MARILILQEEPAPGRALRKSLQAHHELIFVRSAREGLEQAASCNPDLIISTVHLEHDDLFAFLLAVRNERRFDHIPFICFCASLSRWAEVGNAAIAKAGEALGADAYLPLQHFRQGEGFDLEAIRQAIESHLPPRRQKSL